MPNTDWSGVRERIAALAEHPRPRRRLRRGGHGFALLPPLTGAELGDLEAWLGVFLPDDYGTFLDRRRRGWCRPVLRCGAGAQHDNRLGVAGRRRRDDRCQPPGGAVPDRANRRDVIEALQAERPHEHDFPTEAQFDRALDDWDVRLEALLEHPSMTVGAICLADEGCGYRDWLVVSGPARGTMWEDPRCVDEDLKPMLTAEGNPVSFGEWYLTWLDATELADRSRVPAAAGSAAVGADSANAV